MVILLLKTSLFVTGLWKRQTVSVDNKMAGEWGNLIQSRIFALCELVIFLHI